MRDPFFFYVACVTHNHVKCNMAEKQDRMGGLVVILAALTGLWMVTMFVTKSKRKSEQKDNDAYLRSINKYRKHLHECEKGVDDDDDEPDYETDPSRALAPEWLSPDTREPVHGDADHISDVVYLKGRMYVDDEDEPLEVDFSLTVENNSTFSLFVSHVPPNGSGDEDEDKLLVFNGKLDRDGDNWYTEDIVMPSLDEILQGLDGMYLTLTPDGTLFLVHEPSGCRDILIDIDEV